MAWLACLLKSGWFAAGIMEDLGIRVMSPNERPYLSSFILVEYKHTTSCAPTYNLGMPLQLTWNMDITGPRVDA